MPGKAERGSIFRLPVYLPDAAWVQGTFQMVANRHGTGTDAASAPGSATARCRQSRSGSPTGMAAVEPLRKIHKKHLRSVFDSATLTADGFGGYRSWAG